MEITKRSLVLVFGTPAGKEETITITNPGESLEGAQIKAVMDTVLATGAVGEKSAVDSIVGAKYVIQQVDEVDLEQA